MLVDGTRVMGCLTLAVAGRGPVTTIEGLAEPGGALPRCSGRYRTLGQIVSVIGCVAEGQAGSDAEIREYMSGNFSRCAAYTHMVEAIPGKRDAELTRCAPSSTSASATSPRRFTRRPAVPAVASRRPWRWRSI